MVKLLKRLLKLNISRPISLLRTISVPGGNAIG
jgi:hypothetical protein